MSNILNGISLRWRLPFVVMVLAALAVLGWRGTTGLKIETDLTSLVAGPSAEALRELSAGRARTGQILFEGTDVDLLRRRADALASELGQTVSINLPKTLKALSGHLGGLLSPTTRAHLLAGRTDVVAKESMSKLFGFVPPIFSVKDDPFLLATDYVMSMQSNLAEGWTIKDGYPVRTVEGRTYLLFAITDGLLDAQAVDLVARAMAFNREHDSEKVWCSGPVFHSATATSSSQAEINLLSGVSLVLVVFLGWMLFRSFRFVVPLLFTVGTAFLCATAALLGVYPHAHVLTFVFGTSLIGLSVDYVYHSQIAGGAQRVARPLTAALATTLASFAPLLFGDVAVLRQMALFTMAGLAGAYMSVFALGSMARVKRATFVPKANAGRPGWFKFARVHNLIATMCMVLLFGGAFVGRGRVPVVCHDAQSFYRPNAFLAASEKTFAALNPAVTTRFAYVKGATLEEALVREEAAGLKGLSALVPSTMRQRENLALVVRLVMAEGSNYTASTGLKVTALRRRLAVSEKGSECLLELATLEKTDLARLMRPFRAAHGLLAPCGKDFVPHDPNITVIEPRQTVERLFAAFFASTLRLLGWSALVLVIFLAVIFRRRFFMRVMPVFAALAITMLLLGWFQIPITFFTLLCFFVLIGLGLDYSIFHGSVSSIQTRRAVWYSFLTSLAGLGLLAFTEFPVTRAMGQTFAIGLFFSYACSLKVRPQDGRGRAGRASRSGGSDGSVWHEQREQSAGRVRLLILWWIYRLLGKNIVKLCVVPVFACIYPFARPARIALARFYAIVGVRRSIFRHLLGFAWSLVDKLDACTLKRDLPRMGVREDDDARAFFDLLDAGKGAFLISTHVGTIEVLPALSQTVRTHRAPHVHAFQQLGHDAEFTRIFLSHFDTAACTLHAVEAIGVETAVEMQQAIVRGDCVLMAGDRVSAGSGRAFAHIFLGHQCAWPKGVFAFAKLMEAPVFFVTCVRTGWNAYEVRMRKAAHVDAAGELLADYVKFLEEEVHAHPEQWYQFYDFFRQS